MYACVIRNNDVGVAVASSRFPVCVRMGCGADGGAREDVIWSESLEGFSRKGGMSKVMKQRNSQRIQDSDDRSCEVASFSLIACMSALPGRLCDGRIT